MVLWINADDIYIQLTGNSRHYVMFPVCAPVKVQYDDTTGSDNHN